MNKNQRKLNAKKLISREVSSGFTLIETLVAITILLLSVVGPLTISSKGLASSILVKEKISAFFLAQEGVELVRNQRDRNTIPSNHSTWLNGLGSCFSVNGCTLDPRNILPTVNSCSAGGCDPLDKNTLDNLYGYGVGANWVASPFTRTIKMYTINTHEVRLSTKISWVSGVTPKSLTIEEYLFNWQ